MDKYEYKLRAEEIKTLIAKKRFAEAAQVADGIDWKRVRSVMMLCTVSDLYKVNRRFEEAKVLLLMANERHPGGRMILYSLCDLAIRMEDTVSALEYYKEFVRVAPNDSGKYILLYKIYEAQDAGLEDRIAVLEELKRRDYREKWAYELAYLYHRIGLATKCVEECDELILWFGEGKYVLKAMELKMLHQPLSPSQQQKYDTRFGTIPTEQETEVETSEEPQEDVQAEGSGQSGEDYDIQVKTMDVGQYNTINLQKELAESMKDYLEPGMQQEPEGFRPVLREFPLREEMPEQGAFQTGDLEYQEAVSRMEGESAAWDLEATGQLDEGLPQTEEAEGTAADSGMREIRLDRTEEKLSAAPFPAEEEPAEAPVRSFTGQVVKMPERKREPARLPEEKEIRMPVYKEPHLETQGTAQMSIEEIMAEWEQVKRNNQAKRMNDVKQRVLQHTGPLFADFEAGVRNGVLEQLQREEELLTEPVKRPAQPPMEERQTAADLQRELRKEEPLPEVEELEEIEEAGASELAAEEAEQAARAAREAEEAEQAARAAREAEEAEQAARAAREAEEAERAARAAREAEEAERAARAAREAEEAEQAARAAREAEEAERAARAAREAERAVRAAREAREEEEGARAAEEAPLRSLTKAERALFAQFVPTKGAMKKLIKALDRIRMEADTGNMIITGAAGADTLTLAKNVVKDVRMMHEDFSGKIAKISGEVLNKKDVLATISKIEGGALIVEKAGGISEEGANNLVEALRMEDMRLVLILEDSRRAMKMLFKKSPELLKCFSCSFHVEALDNATLVAYGCKYALNLEYAIDELGKLALHTRIEDMQTSEHAVTISDVRDIVDEAIDHAERKTLRHFFDVLTGKRYNEKDMIILRERDFI